MFKTAYCGFKIGENVVLNESIISNGKHVDKGIELIITNFNKNTDKEKYKVGCIAQDGSVHTISKSILIKSKSGWKFIDADTNQWGRQIKTCKGKPINLFEFSEVRAGEVYQSGIDLSAYTNGEIEEVISSYGYTLFTAKNMIVNVYKEYEKDANWIIAECMFETQD